MWKSWAQLILLSNVDVLLIVGSAHKLQFWSIEDFFPPCDGSAATCLNCYQLAKEFVKTVDMSRRACVQPVQIGCDSSSFQLLQHKLAPGYTAIRWALAAQDPCSVAMSCLECKRDGKKKKNIKLLQRSPV